MQSTILKTLARAAAMAGAAAASFVGGFDRAFSTLLIFMITDFALGTCAALFFRASTKTDGGGFRSVECRRGLMRKFATLAMVVIASRVDLLLGADYVRNACVGCFIANEALSIFENLALMGVPVPRALSRALEALHEKEDK